MLLATKQMIQAQGLTKTADGEGTVLFKGTNLGINVGKTDFTFGANNLQKSIGAAGQFIFGANIKGENKSGLSTLFSKGDAVPSGTLNGFLGYSWSNATFQSQELASKRIRANLEAYYVDFFADFKNQIYYITSQVCQDSTQFTLRKAILDKLDVLEFADHLEPLIKPVEDEDAKIANAKSAIKKVYDDLIKKYALKIKAFEADLATLEKRSGSESYFQLMAFGFADYSATQFKRSTAIDPVDYTKSFQDVNVRGDKIGLGVNVQWKNMKLGLTYSHASTSNFALLSKKTYTFKNTQVNGTQSLTEEKAITAYSGAYGTLKVNEVAADLIFNLKLDKKAKNHILIDPYVRVRTSTNTTLLPNTFNLGSGFYFFQQTGKFLGGFYVELPDVNNNYEKMKPEADRRIREPLQRLSFGLVGVLSLSSILGIN